jgi:hypothetical protein
MHVEHLVGREVDGGRFGDPRPGFGDVALEDSSASTWLRHPCVFRCAKLLHRPRRLLGFDGFLREEGLALLGLGLAKTTRVGPRGMNVGELAALLESGGKAISAWGRLQLLR